MAEFGTRFKIPRQYEDTDALLKAGRVDALVVGTPNYLHASQTIAALMAGVQVMVEKPMAMNAREAEQMHGAALKSGAALMVAHCWRFDPDVLWLKERSNIDCGRPYALGGGPEDTKGLSLQGGNYRLSELQAALALAGIERFPAQASQREKMAAYMDESLSEIPACA